MIDSIYHFLDALGYSHPLHPPLTHMPIGLVVGALIFALVAGIFHRPELLLLAKYCIILAFIFFFPTVILGYMDWHHYYAGAWLFPIKIKLLLAGFFFILLSLAIILGRTNTQFSVVLTLYSLCFLTVVGLGYFGGQLVFGGKCPPPPSEEYRAGAKIFASYCNACHPNGGNVINPNLPLRNSPPLSDYETFVAFVRNPRLPDGSRGAMPAFPASRLSDQQMRDLYQYIVNVLEAPKRKT